MKQGGSSLCTVLLGIIVLGVFSTGNGSTTPCNQNNASLCLDKVKDILTSREWWFGDAYSTQCPESRRRAHVECFNPDPARKTILERAFQRDGVDVNKITQVLRVRYNVPKGRYNSCGRRVDVPAVCMSRDLDPTLTTAFDLWTLSHRPAVIWANRPGVLYALTAFDVGGMTLAGLWVNVNGTDAALGQEVYPYHGPASGLDRSTPFVFLLFEQSDEIPLERLTNITESIRAYMNLNNGTYSLDHFTTVASETRADPVAASVLEVKTDSYGIERLRQRRELDNCPWLLQRSRSELHRLVTVYGLGELGANLSDLEVKVEVDFYTEEIEFVSCCLRRKEPWKYFRVDPFDDTPQSPVFLREQPFVRISPVNLLDKVYPIESYFTLVFVDVTSAISIFGSRDYTPLHWLVTNIWNPYPSGRDPFSDVLYNYTAPLPRLYRRADSIYAFLVFRQRQGEMKNVTLDGRCAVSAGWGNGSCDFDLHGFVEANDLHLSGVSLINSRPDFYSRMVMYKQQNWTKDYVCVGVDYTGTCVNASADMCVPDATLPKIEPESTAFPSSATPPASESFVMSSADIFSTPFVPQSSWMEFSSTTMDIFATSTFSLSEPSSSPSTSSDVHTTPTDTADHSTTTKSTETLVQVTEVIVKPTRVVPPGAGLPPVGIPPTASQGHHSVVVSSIHATHSTTASLGTTQEPLKPSQTLHTETTQSSPAGGGQNPSFSAGVQPTQSMTSQEGQAPLIPSETAHTAQPSSAYLPQITATLTQGQPEHTSSLSIEPAQTTQAPPTDLQRTAQPGQTQTLSLKPSQAPPIVPEPTSVQSVAPGPTSVQSVAPGPTSVPPTEQSQVPGKTSLIPIDPQQTSVQPIESSHATPVVPQETQTATSTVVPHKTQTSALPVDSLQTSMQPTEESQIVGQTSVLPLDPQQTSVQPIESPEPPLTMSSQPQATQPPATQPPAGIGSSAPMLRFDVTVMFVPLLVLLWRM